MSPDKRSFDLCLCIYCSSDVLRSLLQVGKVIVDLLLRQFSESWSNGPFDTLHA